MKTLLAKIEGAFIGILVLYCIAATVVVCKYEELEQEEEKPYRPTPYEAYLKEYKENSKKRGPIGFCVNR